MRICEMDWIEGMYCNVLSRCFLFGRVWEGVVVSFFDFSIEIFRMDLGWGGVVLGRPLLMITLFSSSL